MSLIYELFRSPIGTFPEIGRGSSSWPLEMQKKKQKKKIRRAKQLFMILVQ